VAAWVAIGKATDKELVKCGSGDHTELTELGDGLGETPVGNAHTHATLDDFGKLHHLWILSHNWIIDGLFFALMVISPSESQSSGREVALFQAKRYSAYYLGGATTKKDITWVGGKELSRIEHIPKKTVL
jgi:hypothetical protein